MKASPKSKNSRYVEFVIIGGLLLIELACLTINNAGGVVVVRI
jgi:hypothetical protein